VCHHKNVGAGITAANEHKFLGILGKSGNKIREMLVQVYGDNTIKKIVVYKWVEDFSEGRESVADEELSGRPATSRTKENCAKNKAKKSHNFPRPLGEAR
jgi:hypothetical protein